MITKSTSSDVLYFGCSTFISYPPLSARAASLDNLYRSSQTAAERSAPAHVQSTSNLPRRDFRGQPQDRSKIPQWFERGEPPETFALISRFFAAEPFQAQSGLPPWRAT